MRRRPSRGAVLLLVLLCLAVLTVVGIALKFSTGSETTSAANEWAMSRAFYAADAGIRWATAEMAVDPRAFLARPEFRDPPDPFGTVSFPMPGHFHGPGGLFSGDPDEAGIRVTVERPSLLGRRIDPGAPDGGRFFYAFEVRVRASEATNAFRYLQDLVADIEVGPLPPDFLENGDGRAIIVSHTTQNSGESMGETEPVRVVSMNWKEQ
jgi:hypothetical protein